MIFYLLKNENVTFDMERSDPLPKLSALVSTCLIRRNKRDQSTCVSLQHYLNSALAEMNMMTCSPTKKLKLEDQIYSKDWNLLLTIAQIPKNHINIELTKQKDFTLEQHEIDFTVSIEGDLISCLGDVCGEDVLLEFVAQKVPLFARRHTELSTRGMKILPFSPTTFGPTTFGCKGVVDFDFELYNRYWYSGFNIERNVTITVTVPDNIAVPPINDNPSINKKLLNEKIMCDTAIVTSNGVKLECHKSFLSAHSKVFQAMLSGNFKESYSHIDMADTTEKGVKALLAYLYHWEIRDAVKNSAIAFELFKVSHKYDIVTLQETMKKLISIKPIEWFELNDALEIYVFVRNLSDGCDRSGLMKKVISVLKANASALQALEYYQELLKNDPNALKELQL